MKRDFDDLEYRKWRKNVRKRDRYRCQMPGCGDKKNLQVHHIVKWSLAPSLRFNVENGITLCKCCHKEITGFEGYYEKLFSEIARTKNG